MLAIAFVGRLCRVFTVAAPIALAGCLGSAPGQTTLVIYVTPSPGPVVASTPATKSTPIPTPLPTPQATLPPTLPPQTLPPTTLPTSPPASEVGTRENPVALGQQAEIDDWLVRVDQVVANANKQIAKANMFNDPPSPGHQYFMISATAKYLGAGSDHLDSSYSMRAVGDLAVEYTTFENDCGVLPEPNLSLDDPTVYTGGVVSGWAACWEIDSNDATSLEMVMKPLLSSEEVWFALH
jgi:hypothetical protein